MRIKSYIKYSGGKIIEHTLFYICTGGHFTIYFVVFSVKHSISQILMYLLSGFKLEIDYKGNTFRTHR